LKEFSLLFGAVSEWIGAALFNNNPVPGKQAETKKENHGAKDQMKTKTQFRASISTRLGLLGAASPQRHC
jgi:hypothetical protein